MVLILAATPLGNLGDASPRLVETLRTADLIVVEDTRMTKKLMSMLDIDSSAPMLVANEHSEAGVIGRVLEAAAHSDVVFVSDAGMPGISDPGYAVVAAARARAAGVAVTIIPGPSAGISALALSGLPTDRFVHEGFIPRKGRKGYFESLATQERTMVFFESPHRLASTLTDAASVFGPDREACVARELTKMFEEVAWGTLEELAHRFAQGTKGEVVVVIAGKPAGATGIDEALAQVEGLITDGVKRSDACARVAKATGMPKRALYSASISAHP
jgi:16S rRNA (cytidine1402-2'-O)-methyltransferase